MFCYIQARTAAGLTSPGAGPLPRCRTPACDIFPSPVRRTRWGLLSRPPPRWPPLLSNTTKAWQCSCGVSSERHAIWSVHCRLYWEMLRKVSACPPRQQQPRCVRARSPFRFLGGSPLRPRTFTMGRLVRNTTAGFGLLGAAAPAGGAAPGGASARASAAEASASPCGCAPPARVAAGALVRAACCARWSSSCWWRKRAKNVPSEAGSSPGS